MAIFLKKTLKSMENIKEIKFISRIKDSTHHVKIAILNLMPTLEDTERHLLKVLDTNMLDIEIDFVYLKNFTKDEKKLNYLKENYYSYEEIKDKNYDGAIITGAPLEHFCYKDISYQKELNDFLDFTKNHVKTTLFLCWASEYAINYFYHINSSALSNKLSGLYEQYIVNPSFLLKGFNEYFFVPQSRYCSINESEVLKNKNLILVSKSNTSGVFIVESKDKKNVFVTGHLEYEKNTLEKEYLRDLKLKIRINEPVNYYKNHKINYIWGSHQILFFHNWLFYYVFK